MIVKLILALVVIIAISYLYSHFRRQDPAKRKQIGFKTLLYVVAGLLLLLVVTGRLPWITAVFASLVPILMRLVPLLLRLLPFLSHWQGRANPVLQTPYLRLQLDQRSGTVSGQVLSGPHAGKALHELSSDALQELLDFYQNQDPESYRLLQAYLQQTRGGEGSYRPEEPATGSMSRREALEILGLDENATPADIQRAHKKLMQRLHPDRGGSNYLAAKVNQAKTVLLKQ